MRQIDAIERLAEARQHCERLEITVSTLQQECARLRREGVGSTGGGPLVSAAIAVMSGCCWRRSTRYTERSGRQRGSTPRTSQDHPAHRQTVVEGHRAGDAVHGPALGGDGVLHRRLRFPVDIYLDHGQTAAEFVGDLLHRGGVSVAGRTPGGPEPTRTGVPAVRAYGVAMVVAVTAPMGPP
ncbi:hypothetical protein ACFW2D_21430 [Streptomyces sp. NPDC058914]|uniref:hypothetical protein n=1 Tax=Streptomyces TaxID=1883 RepID=UPI0036C50F57